MEDLYANLQIQLSTKLARKEHSELLKVLVEWLREGGGELVERKIKEMVKEVVGEERG